MTSQIELIEGSTRDHSKSQFFTPPKLAQRLVDWARVSPEHPLRSTPIRVLEPSAGNGAIVRPLVAAGAHVTAVEVDVRYTRELQDAGAQDRWCGQDFLAVQGNPGFDFDLACGNFPFHLDLDGAFTSHALQFAPRVCAIYPANVFYAETREKLWTQVRPTRVAHIAKRPWPGATDYVALELVKRGVLDLASTRHDQVTVEWWYESWT